MQQNQAQDPEVTITLKVSQLNVIIAGLDEIPHKFSRPIIDAINQQATEQFEKSAGGSLADKIVN